MAVIASARVSLVGWESCCRAVAEGEASAKLRQ
jgi:hypothetical protein